MEITKLSNMTRGWFIGNFEPSLCKVPDVEVAIKPYKVGDYEEPHYHKVATEYTVVLEGSAEMVVEGKLVKLEDGDIIVVSPGEVADFRCTSSCRTVVVKIPGASNDKYLVS